MSESLHRRGIRPAVARALRDRWRQVRQTPDQGRIMVLSMGFMAVALALVLVVASATAIHIQRKALLALADGAAVAAADALDADAYYREGADGVPLTDASVRQAVADYLAQAPAAGRFHGLRVASPTGSPDGRTAEVTLGATLRPPFLPWGMLPGVEGIDVTVTSRAQGR